MKARLAVANSTGLAFALVVATSNSAVVVLLAQFASSQSTVTLTRASIGITRSASNTVVIANTVWHLITIAASEGGFTKAYLVCCVTNAIVLAATNRTVERILAQHTIPCCVFARTNSGLSVAASIHAVIVRATKQFWIGIADKIAGNSVKGL